MTTRTRTFCWTLHDPTLSEQQILQAMDVRYMIYGREVCPETQRPHLQGFTMFKNAKTWEAAKAVHSVPRLHLEPCKGSPSQNIDYCSKTDTTPFEKGTRPKQGKRSDLEIVREIVATGGTMRETLTQITSVQSIRMAEKLLTYEERKRDWKPTVHWYHGLTGTGKTRAVAELVKEKDAYWCNPTNKWWDGYDGHDVIVIDDMRGSFCSFSTLLRILDRYEYRVEYKGGYRQLLAKEIYITSCLSPREMYFENTFDDNSDRIDQLLRRIDEIKIFT